MSDVGQRNTQPANKAGTHPGQMSEAERKRLDAIRRLVTRATATESGCWIYTGSQNENGYGTFYLDGATLNASRAAWQLFVGPPGDLFVCHHCDNPPCINPDHLFLGTNRENQLDSSSKGRNIMQRHPELSPLLRRIREMTCCKRGHPFTPENLAPRKDGRRQCLKCKRAKDVREALAATEPQAGHASPVQHASSEPRASREPAEPDTEAKP